jgi:hypothetical protein
MAKVQFNKSAAIRDLLAKHKRKSPLAITALMKSEHNVVVTPQYVSTVKSHMKARRGAKKITRRGKATGAVTTDNQAAFFAAAEFLVKAGGINAAREILAAVAKVAAIVG